jgi:manganese transport protein
MEEKVSVHKRGWWRRLFSFIGPAYLVSVGYMDPGNWATDIEGGSRFGYTLIWVLLMSNLMALLLQTLSARLGIVSGYDLAQGCRREYPNFIRYNLWILAEIAIAATDLAEVLGTILGLNLLFGLPLLWGCAVTAFDTFLLLAIQRLGIRKMEGFIVMLVGTIGACFLLEISLAKPDWTGIAGGFIPRLEPGALYIAIGIIGATVMPHNLYLHSSLVQSRAFSNTYTGKAEAAKFNLIDSFVALNAAFLVNAAILVMSAANFHSRGILVTQIQQAHNLLEPLLGTHLAPMAFAIALLASGQSSTLTGTISGQVVMEGFLNIRMRPWLRRLLTRSIALIPAIFAIAARGSEGTYQLLILSQVILSLQLPFAVIPLIHFTSDPNKLGVFANQAVIKVLAWGVAAVIAALNMQLVWGELTGVLPGSPLWLWAVVLLGVFLLIGVLLYITFGPWFMPSRGWETGMISSGRKIAHQIKPLRVDHIGVALEHSEGDREIVSAAISMANLYKARLTLLHVVETPGAMVLGENSASLHSREDNAYLEDLAREIEGEELKVETWLGTGNRIDKIVESIQHLGLDMLVLGSHGHKGLGDLIFGQTVDSVRHAISIPVLVVRIPEARMEKPQRSP